MAADFEVKKIFQFLCLAFFLLPAIPTDAQQGPTKSREVSLVQILEDIGAKYDRYFTIEEFDEDAAKGGYTNQQPELSTRVLPRECPQYRLYPCDSTRRSMHNADEELRNIASELPDFTYWTDARNPKIIHVVETSLKKRASSLDQTTDSINFSGTIGGLVDYFSRRGLKIHYCSIYNNTPFGVMEVGYTQDNKRPVAVSAEQITVRDILSDFTPLENRYRIVWVAEVLPDSLASFLIFPGMIRNVTRTEKLPLIVILSELADKYDRYYTAEETIGIRETDLVDYRLTRECTGARGWLDCDGTQPGMHSLEEELDGLSKEVPNLAYEIDYRNPNIFHIIDGRLRGSVGYPMEQIIPSIKFKGKTQDMVNYIQKLGIHIGLSGTGNGACTFEDRDRPIEISANRVTVRDVLSDFMPIENISRILWTAQVYDAGHGLEVGFISPCINLTRPRATTRTAN